MVESRITRPILLMNSLIRGLSTAVLTGIGSGDWSDGRTAVMDAARILVLDLVVVKLILISEDVGYFPINGL